MPTFNDIAPDLGIDLVRTMYGPNLADYDSDGRLDLFFTNHLDPTTLFRQQPSGQVLDTTDLVGIDRGGDTHGAAWGDCDGDGRLDLYIVIGVNHGTSSNPNRLYRQLDDGTFIDVASEAGVADSLGRARSVSWVDYNNDGHLDLFVANALRADSQISFDKLFRNDGDGTFSDMSGHVGDLAISNHTHGSSWADYDNDGDMDVFVTSVQAQGAGRADLYRNDAGTFTRVPTSQSGILDENAAGMAWGDYDNDGDLDLFVTRGWSPVAGNMPTANRLYRNNGNRTFSQVETEAGVRQNLNSHHVVWADFDNDGDLDLYVTNSGLLSTGNQPNFLYENQGDGTFQEIAAFVGATGTTSTGMSSGCAVGDFNNDGFPDIVITNGLNLYSSGPSFGPHQLLLNQGNDAHWVQIKLFGQHSNRLGIGARVELTTDNGLYQMREMNGGVHRFSQNDMLLHFGLGSVTHAKAITVTWPSGLKQVLREVLADQILTITESEPLIITKSVRVVPVRPGSYLTYTLTVTNQPTSAAPATDVVVTDILPDCTTFIDAGFIPPASGTVYTERVDAIGVITWTIGTIAVGNQAQLYLTVYTSLTDGTIITNTCRITSDALPGPVGHTLTTTITNALPVPGGNNYLPLILKAQLH